MLKVINIIIIITLFACANNKQIINSESFINFSNDLSLDIVTWNIENYPKNSNTNDYLLDLISLINADVIALQEINDKDEFDKILYELTDYSGYYKSGWYAGLAYIYKKDIIKINNIYEIFTSSPYWNVFPRSPMIMEMSFMNNNYFIINNHFKCCGDGNLNIYDDSDEENRRFNAINLLKNYIDIYLPYENVIILGDFNDSLVDTIQHNIFQKILNDSANYMFVDYNIEAFGTHSDWSYPTYPSHLDHICITNELFSVFEKQESSISTFRIEDYFYNGWNDYEKYVSDHRPVALKLQVN